MQTQRIKSIRKLGKSRTIDLEVENEFHNFFADGVVVSNSHATAYASVCAITAHLKHLYPKEFFLHCLNIAKNETESGDLIARIYAEMKVWGIKMLPPDLSIGNDNFISEKGGIRYGLSAIKGLSDAKLQKLRLFKPDKSSKFALLQSAKDAGLDITAVNALIYAGAISCNESDSRCRFAMEARLWGILTAREKKVACELGPELNYDIIAFMKKAGADSLIAESRLETIRKEFAPFLEIYKQNSQYEDLTNWHFERDLLGFAYTKTLKQIFEVDGVQLISSTEAQHLEPHATASFVGVVKFIKHGRTKKGDLFSRMIISDEVGEVGAFLFEPHRNRLINEEKKVLPQEGEIYSFTASKNRSGEMLYIIDYSDQKNRIFLKTADFKAAK